MNSKPCGFFSIRIRPYALLLTALLFSGALAAQCISGDCKNGKGTYRFESGAQFSGEFLNGKMVSGTYTYANGEKYVGAFKNGKRNGMGTYYYNSGNVFQGEFVEGEKKEGTFKYIDGSVYKGEFQNSKKWGRGVFTAADGSVYDGYWENGNFLGSQQNNPVTTYMVVVGIADYLNFEPGQGDLKFTINDARAFYNFALTGHMGAVSSSNVRLLLDSDASHDNILRQLDAMFSRADENDRVIFYYSGHGDRDKFVPYDVALNDPSSFLTHADVKAAFKRSKAKNKFLIADACYSGSMHKDLRAQIPAEEAADIPKKYEDVQVAIMLSCTGDEVSWELGEIGQGAFTYFLVEGMKGEADANLDDAVSIEELYYFVRNNTYNYVKENIGKTQRPVLFGQFDRNMIISN